MIDTDVLYQWRNLVPTIERRLTPIKNVYLDNIKSNQCEVYFKDFRSERTSCGKYIS
ncbi:MAG: hypothetical protein ABI793_11370 [Flavobacterium sp.]